MIELFNEHPEEAMITKEEAKKCVGEGWGSLLDELYSGLSNTASVTDVKEKWGGLRTELIYATKEDLDLSDLIEGKSLFICEGCGKKGKLRPDLGWKKTLCNRHYNELIS